MKRIPIPPTKYDPMRPVQAKMAVPTGGPGLAIPPTQYAPVPVQARAIIRNDFLVRAQPSVRSNQGCIPVRGGVVQRAAAAGGGGARRIPTRLGRNARFRTRPSDGVVAHFDDDRLIKCRGSALYIGDDAKIAAKLNANNIHCLAVRLEFFDEIYTTDINKQWLEFYRMQGRTFYLLMDAGFELNMCLENRYIIKDVKGAQSEVCYLASYGYKLAQNPLRLVAPAKFLVPQPRQVGAQGAAKPGAAAAASALTIKAKK